MMVPVRAHGTTGRVLARRYMRNDRNVVRIIRLTAVFLALITPRAPRNGWCDPPIAASSFESAIMVWGVPHRTALKNAWITHSQLMKPPIMVIPIDWSYW